jgi:ferredoxin-thioredoxin reductase catalytic chain
MTDESEPSATSLARIRKYVDKYRDKTGMAAHPVAEVGDAVVKGLALNLDLLGKPLCPCNFYPDKQAELDEHGRRWVCACDEMKQFKYCHCLLFVTPEGLPITEYLPEDHDGRQTYGLVQDPTPDRGREGRASRASGASGASRTEG